MKKVRSILLICVVMIALLINSYSVYASGGGVPFSSGSKPLNFVSCTLEDGNKIIAGEEISTLQPKFILMFDKNVVNMLVWQNNRKAITMYSDNNTAVLIDVSKIDDTVDFDHRQQIFVQPINTLEYGKTYYIYISPDLKAKNENSVLSDTTKGKGIIISFKTKDQVVQSGTSSPVPKKQNGLETKEQPISTANSSPESAKASTEQNTSKNDTKPTNLDQTQNNNSKSSANIALVEKKFQDSGGGKISKSIVSKSAYMPPNATNWSCIIYIALGAVIILWIVLEFFVWRKNKERNKAKNL